jgi:hypothetical protein
MLFQGTDQVIRNYWIRIPYWHKISNFYEQLKF